MNRRNPVLAAKGKNPLKQLHLISGVTFVVIDESHVQRLAISDKNDAWVEQLAVEDGILLKLKIRRNYEGT